MELNRISLRGASLGRVPLPRISLQGRGGDTPLDFSGYPLALDLPNARSMKNYTIFGNTSEDAKGVGDEVVQMVSFSDGTAFLNGITITKQGGKFSFSGICTASYNYVLGEIAIISGHKYALIDGGVKYPISGRSVASLQLYFSGINLTLFEYGNTSGEVGTATASGTATLRHRFDINEEYNIADSYPLIFDLTAIYGSGNEPATADDFAQRLGYADAAHLPAFPYGSSFVAPIRVGSRNLWDEEWENKYINTSGVAYVDAGTICTKNLIAVEQSKTYYLKKEFGKAMRINYYDANKVFLRQVAKIATASGGGTFTPDADAVYFGFFVQNTPTYNHDICVNLSDERNGEYSPYFAPTLYPSVLSSPLHQIGDIVDYKESNGPERHALWEVDLGTLEWEKSTSERFRTRLSIMAKEVPNNIAANAYCAHFEVASDYSVRTHAKENIIAVTANSFLYLYTNSEYFNEKTAAELKASLAGVPLIYELATPTEVQGEPLPRLAIPRGTSIVTLDTAVEPSNITAKV